MILEITPVNIETTDAPFCCGGSPRQRMQKHRFNVHWILRFTVGEYQISWVCTIVFKLFRLRASTRIRTRCVCKSFHSGDRFQRFAVTVGVFTVYVWTLSVTATQCLRIQTNPYTCGRGLNTGSRQCTITRLTAN